MKKNLVAIIIFIILPVIVCAQTHDLTVKATVLSSFTVATRTLDFGYVQKGVNKTVLPDNPNAGRWDLTGTPNAEVSISFFVPTSIVSSSNAELSMDASTNHGKYSNSDQSGATGTLFNPHSSIVTRLSSGGKLYIFVGGIVSPSSTQSPGDYSSNSSSNYFSMTINYTGN